MLNYEFDKYFKIEECKKQLRIYHDEDNDEIILKAETALVGVSNYINRNIYPTDAEIPPGDEYSISFNRAIRGATLLLLSDLYENRTINLEQSAQRNSVFDLLLGPWMNYAVRGV